MVGSHRVVQGEHGMVRAHEWDVSRRLARAPGGRRPWWVAHPGSAEPPLRLDWESTGAHAVVLVSGDLDALTSPQLDAVVAARPSSGLDVLEIDVSGVRSVGSVGLSVLLGVRQWCLHRGVELRVRGAHRSVWRVFEEAGLDVLFTSPPATAGQPAPQGLTLF
jgi:anti-anti-sigma factor